LITYLEKEDFVGLHVYHEWITSAYRIASVIVGSCKVPQKTGLT